MMLNRLIWGILGVVLWAVAPAAGHEDCSLCLGDAVIDCPSCEAKGATVEKCQKCYGSGKEICVCRRISELLRDTNRCPKCRGKKSSICGSCAIILKSPVPDKGKLLCLNQCDRGQLHYPFDVVRACLFCRSRKGQIDCELCKDGTRKCSGCNGREKVEAACLFCAATGKVPCPVIEKVSSGPCLLCGRFGQRSCGGSTGPARAAAPKCGGCSGDGRAMCSRCFGLGRTPCRNCNAAGTIQIVMVDRRSGAMQGRGGRKSCDDCKKLGVQPCADCSKGKVQCEDCEGTGRGRGHCVFCDEDKSLPCGGCRPDPIASFETLAAVLESNGSFKRALELLREGRRVLKETTGEELRERGYSRDEVDKMTQGASERLNGLEQRLKTLEARVGDSSDLEPKGDVLAVATENEPSRPSEPSTLEATAASRETKKPEGSRGAKNFALAGRWKTTGGSWLLIDRDTSYVEADWEYVARFVDPSRKDRSDGWRKDAVLLKLKRGEGKSPFYQGKWMTDVGRSTADGVEQCVTSGELSHEDLTWKSEEEDVMWEFGVVPLSIDVESGGFYQGVLVRLTGKEVPVYVVVGKKSARIRGTTGKWVGGTDRFLLRAR